MEIKDSDICVLNWLPNNKVSVTLPGPPAFCLPALYPNEIDKCFQQGIQLIEDYRFFEAGSSGKNGNVVKCDDCMRETSITTRLTLMIQRIFLLREPRSVWK
ncbi:hypothetical protein RCL_jg19098.t1 [Rhizophagus clarus]|uniref:Uncharacterized protein n=1 Tax=Rhizophagus clarus TaxID=94130 RepID=A0A8H3LZH8_9GLOM|nr:hypothetical protein RCL_jg19098.t1 [Rhizophagus clarus]